MPEVLTEQLTGQGTRLSKDAPWMTYSKELDQNLSPQLQQEVEEYSKRRHEKSSSQNEEELCYQKELNAKIAKDYQWLTPEEYEEEEPRIGRVLHSSTFITMLRNSGVRCWYRQHPQVGKITLLVQSDECLPPVVGCWVQAGNMPELSFSRFDEHGVPLDERLRGWRTCLLQLILQGLITEQTANDTFGYPGAHKVFTRYKKLLFEFRHRGNGWERKA